MKMTPVVILFGSSAVLLAVIFGNIMLPAAIWQPKPSASAVPYSKLELEGRQLYVQNGCVYCHSQDTRPMDWDIGSGDAAEPGDYAYDSPHLVGSERNGPDLFREGGYHTDDWHWAHFEDPRFTRPQSFMPSFKYIKGQQRRALIAYIQCLGGRTSRERAAEQDRLQVKMIAYYGKGVAENVAYLNSTMPKQWLTMPNPEPITAGSIDRGHTLYLAYCAGCHGPAGDGRGQAKPYLDPPPMDFTLLQASGASPSTTFNGKSNHVSPLNNGIIYYAVLNGIPGSAMPAFKGQLESEKIWDVGNYVGVAFMGWKTQGEHGEYQEISELGRPGDPRLFAKTLGSPQAM